MLSYNCSHDSILQYKTCVNRVLTATPARLRPGSSLFLLSFSRLLLFR